MTEEVKKAPNLWHKYETNKDAELEGVWIEGFEEGVDVKIAKFGNKKQEKLLEELRRPYRKTLRVGGKIPDDVAAKFMAESMAKHILLDWRGMTDINGNPLPYSVENAQKVLLELEGFADKVSALSLDRDNIVFNKKALEDERKNLSTASSGNSESAETLAG